MSENQKISTEGTVPAATAKTRKNIPLAKFIPAWETSESGAEVCDKLGLDHTHIDSVLARASKHRSQGLALKNMPKGGGPKVNMSEMQALLASLKGVDVAEVTAKGEALKAAAEARKAEREAS